MNRKENTEDDFSEETRDIDASLDPLFAEVGLKREEHKIYKVKGDGACGCNCVGVHCHGEGKLGPYVRMNINKSLVKFWPFYQYSYTFPMVLRVGSGTRPFQTEAEYMNFLANDPDSKLLWVDHQDWQVIANVYQMKIHILTVGVQDTEKQKAR